MTARTVLWDFDGTLARRPGMWGGCLLEVLTSYDQSHGLTREMLSPHLQHGFPWHDHHVAHPELNEPDAWWHHVNGLLASALIAAGVAEGDAREVAALVRDRYTNPEAWELITDANCALAKLAAAGWRNVIVSNHVPELDRLVEDLGLGGKVEAVISSARYGYEKPQARLFEIALARTGARAQDARMVGDNPIADIAGAARAHIPGVWIQIGPVDDDFRERLRRGYGHSGWDDWEQHCKHVARTPLEAADRILDHTAAGALPRWRDAY